MFLQLFQKRLLGFAFELQLWLHSLHMHRKQSLLQRVSIKSCLS